MKIVTAHYISPVGKLKIECTDEFLKALKFADDDIILPAIEHKILSQCISELDEYFAGKREKFNLPINQEGTEFQTKIWDLLFKIPYGRTISYIELSKQYGDTKAIRAAASANGKNNICIIVPCHRVVGSDQSLTGYSGGLWRKKWLLEHEAKYHSGVQQLF